MKRQTGHFVSALRKELALRDGTRTISKQSPKPYIDTLRNLWRDDQVAGFSKQLLLFKEIGTVTHSWGCANESRRPSGDRQRVLSIDDSEDI